MKDITVESPTKILRRALGYAYALTGDEKKAKTLVLDALTKLSLHRQNDQGKSSIFLDLISAIYDLEHFRSKEKHSPNNSNVIREAAFFTLGLIERSFLYTFHQLRLSFEELSVIHHLSPGEVYQRAQVSRRKLLQQVSRPYFLDQDFSLSLSHGCPHPMEVISFVDGRSIRDKVNMQKHFEACSTCRDIHHQYIYAHKKIEELLPLRESTIKLDSEDEFKVDRLMEELGWDHRSVVTKWFHRLKSAYPRMERR